jgi:hypothetical protein
MARCQQCDDIGWRQFEIDGQRFVEPCHHCRTGLQSAGELAGKLFGNREACAPAQGQPAEAAPSGSSVKPLRRILIERDELRTFFDETDLDMADEIYAHVGEAQAISIRDLAARFFPDATKDGAARGIKERISRMRRLAHLMVCSRRGIPGGYYTPASVEEWNRYRNELWKHTLAWLEICHDADHEGHWVAEQLGQLVMQWQANL